MNVDDDHDDDDARGYISCAL